MFPRVPLEPRSTADQTSSSTASTSTYNAIDPDSVEDSETSYSSAGGGQVGQSLVYVVSTTNDGATWSHPVAVDPARPDTSSSPTSTPGRTIAVVWQDNRTDDDYNVQLPIGNTSTTRAGRCRRAPTWSTPLRPTRPTADVHAPADPVSSEGHQPSYEMFGNRDFPFQGDYNWISLAERGDGSLFGYMTWTDNRNVVEGDDLRETTAEGGYDDNFDVLQCRNDLGAPSEDDVLDGVPLARATRRSAVTTAATPAG